MLFLAQTFCSLLLIGSMLLAGVAYRAFGQSRHLDGSGKNMFENAVRALSAEDYAAAEEGFQTVLRTSPKNIGALGNLGVVYSRTGQTDKAIETYRKALALSPSDPQLLLNLGLVCLKAEREPEALRVFRKLSSVRPDDPRAQELLATSELYAGSPAAGVAILHRLLTHDSNNPALLYLLGTGYLKLQRHDEARSAFERFLSATPPAVAGLALCKAYYRSGYLEEAEKECRSALAHDPTLGGADRELGKVLVSRRDPEASEYLRAAIQKDQRDAEALYFLGAVLVGNEKPEQAIPLLETARKLNPGFWGNYFYLGRARLQQNRPAAAVELLRKAAELNPSESSVFYQLGRACAAAGQSERARQAMARVRELKARELQSETVPKPSPRQ